MKRFTTTALATLIAAPIALAQPALAQTTDGAQAIESDQDQITQQDQTTEVDQADADPLLATVGDTQINASDVSAAIAMMPQQIQQQPVEQLMPFALEQLIMRHLVLQTASAEAMTTGDQQSDAAMDSTADATASTTTGTATADEGNEAKIAKGTDSIPQDDDAGTDTAQTEDQSGNMAQSRDAESIATDNSGASSENVATGTDDTAAQLRKENETIQAFVDERMEGVVTDETVQAAYDSVKEQSTTEIPPLDAVRPQLERQLRQQEMRKIRDEMMENIEVVFYGPDGEPREVEAETETDDG